MKVVGAFNQEKDLVAAFSVIVKTNGSFAALGETPLRWLRRSPTANTSPVYYRCLPLKFIMVIAGHILFCVRYKKLLKNE